MGANRFVSAPPATEQALGAASAALLRHDGHTALSQLLDAWRACPSARIAALIDALSVRLDSQLPRVPEADFHAAWLALARQATDADIPRLLPGLMRGPLGDKLIERVRVVTLRAPDPRIAAGLMAMVDEPPATSQSIIGKLWGPIFTALESIGDGRQREALTRRLERQPGPSKFWPQHYRKIETLLKKLPSPPEPTQLDKPIAQLTSAIAKLKVSGASVAAKPKATKAAPADDPLALVYAEPTSIEARMVCADRLIELGDPRGELIVVQKKILDGNATTADHKRERDLIRQQGERLLPPELASVVTAKQYGFHLGFLGDCEVVFTSDAEVESLVPHRAWRTIRELYCDEMSLLTRADLVALERIGSFDLALLGSLARGKRALPVTCLGPIYADEALDAMVTALADTDAPAFPQVRTLDFFAPGGWEQWRWLTDVPLAQRLTSLSFLSWGDIDPAFVTAFKALPRLAHIDFYSSQRCYRLERVDGELTLWIGMQDGRIDGLMALNEHHANELKRMMSALRPVGVKSFVLADALANPQRKALPALATMLEIPHAPERNRRVPTANELNTRHVGRQRRQQQARAKRQRAR